MVSSSDLEMMVVGLVYKAPRQMRNLKMPKKWHDHKFMLVEFWLRDSLLKVIECANPFSYDYFLRRGKTYQYNPPLNFFL